MHNIAQKQIFIKKLPELDLDPELVVKFPDPDMATLPITHFVYNLWKMGAGSLLTEY
jgi:hypothetical protein